MIRRLTAALESAAPAGWTVEAQRYKPTLYAEAGIRCMWRVEDEQGLPVIHTYERDDTTGAYVPTGVHRERLTTSVPFPVDLTPAGLAG